MPQPFSVASQSNPGKDLGHWDANGNIVVPGSVTANGVVLGGGGGGGGTGTVTSVAAGDNSIAIGGTATIAPTVAVQQANLVLTESQITNLTSDLALKAPLAAPALTGTATAVNLTVSGRLSLMVDVITFASTITPDCSTGNDFRCTLTGAVTVAAPINPVDGQKITFEFIQDATGSRVVTLNSAFHFGTTLTSFTASTAANKRDRVGVIYNATAGTFDVVAIAQGF